MKLHLPLPLRRFLSLVVVSVATLGSGTLDAAVMNSDVSFVTYADFGQNLGRYKTDDTANALLKHLRSEAGGVALVYSGGQADFVLPHEMANFTGTTQNGAFMALGHNATVSVQHNGVTRGGFTGNYIGAENTVFYQGIEYRIDNSATFLHSPYGGYDNRSNGGFDHKVTRMSKLITDVETATLFSGTSSEMREYVQGELLYHAGAGSMKLYDAAGGEQTDLCGGYVYIIGGVDAADSVGVGGANGVGDTIEMSFKKDGYYSISSSEPLPFSGANGDSGSPILVYNEKTAQYEYVGALAYIGNNSSSIWGAVSYVDKVLNSYDKVVNSASAVLHIGAVNEEGTMVSADDVAYDYNQGRTVSTTPWSGKVTDVSGNTVQSFVGVKNGINTWKDLSSIIDNDNWYAYNNTYLNAASYLEGKNSTADKELTYADLFLTENLVFKAGAATTDVVLDATVDLGIGYAQFSLGENMESARFNISSGEDGSYQFNHAGYVIDAGVEVHSTLTGSADHVYEWRKTGEGALYIEGSGNNRVLLNVGGRGATYLNRVNGYAAYNVLANTHATVVIADRNQIARDFTFGHEGGVLDMNGNSMTWNNDNNAAADGFTIHALDENAVIANMKENSETTLTWTQVGEQTFLGSFRDDGDTAVLKFVYDGGADSKLTLNSVFTELRSAGSGMVVNSGTLVLQGTNTVHGLGSATGRNAERYFNAEDWHYADATSDVTVKNNAVFELGSHARLTGDVTVESGGTFVMRESVQHKMEYIEGGERPESTDAISAYHGLKGNVSLAAGADMLVEYGKGVTADATYAGDISGEGNVSVNLGNADISLTLSGNNTFSGMKSVANGGLIGETAASLGDTSANKWVIGENAWIASHAENGNELLNRIDTSSVGTLALSADTNQQLDFSRHSGLYLGAEAGTTVQYGTAGTSEALLAVDGAWRLGGGGGKLVVNYVLSGSYDLLLGGGSEASGVVHLTNTSNQLSGSITFNSTGIRLTYEEGALGDAVVGLTYGNGILVPTASALNNVAGDSEGAALLEGFASDAIDMSKHGSLALGASQDTIYDGRITLAAGQSYRFSSMNGAVLTVNSALAAGHEVVVDGQGGSGGTVILNGAGAVNGAVTVMGHRDGLAGDVTLGFAADNTLNSASSVAVQVGGILDLGSTNQTLRNLSVQNGGTVRGDSDSTLVLELSENVTQMGTLQLGQVVKKGAVDMVLGASDNEWKQLSVQEGSLVLATDNALSATGTTRVESGAVLNLGTKDDLSSAGNVVRRTHGAVVLANGATLLTGSEATDNGTALTGSLSVDAGGRATVSGYHLHLSGRENNIGGGTIDYAASSLHLNTTAAQHIGGTVNIAADTQFHSGGSATDMLKHFNHVNLDSGRTLALEDKTWNTIWQVDKLTGAGTLNWNSDTNHSSTARVLIGGDGGFSGTINMNRSYSNKDRIYQAYLEINAENAVTGATVNLNGSGEYSPATLAVNAANVNIGGLNGNAYSHVMAGAAPTDSAQTVIPVSTRSASLSFTGSGNYTYSGTIGSTEDKDDAALSLVMKGSGTQTLNGSSIVVKDVSALSGNLSIESAGFRSLGDVAVAQGAALKINDSFALESGRTLSVRASENSGAQAEFRSALVLNGGIISFDSRSLGSTALLNLSSGLSLGNATEQVINFDHAYALRTGVTYTLSNGDWSALSGKMAASGAEYLTAAFTNNSDSLQVTFSAGAGYLIWDGTNSYGSNMWTATNFGTQSATAGTYSAVVFDDTAAGTTVYTWDNVSVDKAIFNSSKNYSVNNWGALATIGTLQQDGSGTTTLTSAVKVLGETRINDGQLVVTDTSVLGGTVSGEGTLVINWNGSGTVSIRDLNTLHIQNGTWGSATSESADAAHIIIESGGSYSQGAGTYTGDVVARGGSVQMVGGTLSGSLTQEADMELNVFSGTSKLNSALEQNGYTITQTGAGTVELGASSAAVLENYVVSSGKLSFTGKKHTAGVLTVHSGAVLIQGNGGSLDAERIELGGTLQAENGNGGYVNADIRVSDGAVIKGGNNAAIRGNISGSGALHLQQVDNIFAIRSDISDGDNPLSLVVNNTAGVILSGDNTFTGGLTLQQGLVRAESAGALGAGDVIIGASGAADFAELELRAYGLESLENIHSLSLKNNAILDLSAADFVTLGGVNLGCNMEVASVAQIQLGNLEQSGKYRIFNLAEGVTLDWENLAGNVYIGDSRVDWLDGASLSVSDGAAWLSFIVAGRTVWNGGATGVWDTSSANWNATEDCVGDNISFTGGSDVAFASDADITVAEGVTAGKLTVDNGVNLRLSGASAQLASVSMGEGSALNITSAQLAAVSDSVHVGAKAVLTLEDKLSSLSATHVNGSGTVSVALDSSYGSTLQLGSEFTGETYVREGAMTLNGAVVGSTLRLADGVNVQFSGNTTATWGANLVLDGTSQLHANNGSDFTFTGTVTGAGVYDSRGSGTVKFNGAVNLGGFYQEKEVTVQFNEAAQLGNLTLKAGSVTFAKSAEIGGGSFSGGSLSVTQNATFNGNFDILGNVTLNANRGNTGDWALTGPCIGGTMTVTEGNTLTVTGNSRVQINDGAALVLQDKASVNRIENGAFYIKGSLATAEKADATFRSKDDVHLNYVNADKDLADTEGSIDVAAGSRLAVQVNNLIAYGKASLNVGENAQLDLSGSSAVKLSTSSKVNLSKNAAVIMPGMEFSNRSATGTATLASTQETNYSIGSTAYTLTNGHARHTSENDTLLANRLVNSSVENAGSGLLTVSHADNSITDVYASAGDLTVLQVATALQLDELVVGESHAVSAYTGTELLEAQEAEIRVSSKAEFAAGARLNANLTLESGSTLKVAQGGVQLGSTLTLQQGLTLDETTLARVHTLSAGESHTLFSGVDTLRLATSESEYQVLSNTDSSILASTYFQNISSDYLLTFTVDKDSAAGGTLALTMAVPEPTTATLSLLALAGLLSRRRRK
ncbi:MAG: hypothetical protein IJB00_00690 [Akkermansia sp.]|nr:hypothetical protein [Akkermansia sp.]